MVYKNVVFIAVLVLCAVKSSYGVIEGSQVNSIMEEIKNETTKGERTGRTLHKLCNGNFSTKCIKIQVLSFLEDLNSRDELSLLLPGLSIVKENTTKSLSAAELAAELSRQFPGKPEEKLNRYILHRLQDYLDGHSLRYRLLDPDTTKEAIDVADGENVETGRQRIRIGGAGGGGVGGGGAMLAAGMMMKSALGAAALGALALLAGKALMTALISLLLSALVGLKGHGGHKSTTYEIITKPEVSHHRSHSHEEHHEHEHGHHGEYRRAYDDGYNSYMPYDTTSGIKYE